MNFLLFSLINIKEIDWSDDFFIVTFNNWTAIFILVLSILFPIALIIIYVVNVERWNKKEFNERYG